MGLHHRGPVLAVTKGKTVRTEGTFCGTPPLLGGGACPRGIRRATVAKPPQRPQETAFYYGCAAHLLIATTALVATAGVAVADVKVSGYARFGADYLENRTATTVVTGPGADGFIGTADDVRRSTTAADDEINIASRLRLQFDATTETDGGLTLGVRTRAESEEGGTAVFNGARFFATAGGLTVAMGNILGVVEAAPGLYMPTKSAGMGLEGNGFTALAANTVSNGGAFNWTAYTSKGAGARDGVEVIYSMNGIGVHAHSTDTSYGIGANYKFADYTVAVAYEDWTDGTRKGDNILFASIGGKFGAFDAGLSYAETEYTRRKAEKFSLRGGYTVNDALYVYGFVADESGVVAVDETYGLGASYALGGGASVEAGWTTLENGNNQVSAGIFFSF
jgi:outer membrane protein OmpU